MGYTFATVEEWSSILDAIYWIFFEVAGLEKGSNRSRIKLCFSVSAQAVSRPSEIIQMIFMSIITWYTGDIYTKQMIYIKVSQVDLKNNYCLSKSNLC